MILKNADIFCPSGFFQETDLLIRGDRVEALGSQLSQEGEEVLDLTGKLVIPGLVDIHIHGAMGADFSDGDPRGNEKIMAYLIRWGVTSWLGTSMSLSEEHLCRVFSTAKEQMDGADPALSTLRGINMEGPFLSLARCGAQNTDFIIPPDIEMFRRLFRLSGDSIRLVDMAPELEGSMDFIREASKLCAVSLAHTAADYKTAAQAYSQGASHATHLYNGMEPFLHREPGTVCAAFDHAAHAELICDGLHIHPAVIRNAFRLLGRDRACLISDSMRAAGLENGVYDLGGQEVTVKDGKATIANGSLAGSVTDLFTCMRRAVAFGVPREQAILAATRNPAKAAGLDGLVGALAPGKLADLLVTDPALNLERVMHLGQWVS